MYVLPDVQCKHVYEHVYEHVHVLSDVQCKHVYEHVHVLPDVQHTCTSTYTCTCTTNYYDSIIVVVSNVSLNQFLYMYT